jgi:hypothetical protein
MFKLVQNHDRKPEVGELAEMSDGTLVEVKAIGTFKADVLPVNSTTRQIVPVNQLIAVDVVE